MLAVAATTLIAVYQWYLAAFDLDADGLSGYVMWFTPQSHVSVA